MGACGFVAIDSHRKIAHLGSLDSDTVVSGGECPSRRLTQNVIRENTDRDIREYYSIDPKSVLGSGLHGEVILCVHKVTKLNYALKTLSKTNVVGEKFIMIRNELNCMASLDHPNILRVHEVFETESSIFLVMDLCKGGHLMNRLNSQTGNYYREKVACKYVHTILHAVAYCHAHNVVHRDLKLENILFETTEYDSEVKIIGTDF